MHNYKDYIDVSSMHPTVLKIYKLDNKIARENIFESWVFVLSTLLQPSVSEIFLLPIKNMLLFSYGT